MDHRTIDAENIAERYVTGRLSPEDAAGFEEHYLDCPVCCARVEAAERLQRGIRRLAEQAAAGAPSGPRLAHWSRSPRVGLAAAALLVLALLPAGLELRENVRLREEMEAARRPQVNLPVLALTSVRGSLEGPVRTLTLAKEPGWIALWVEPGDADFPAYQATLRSASGAVVFQSSGLTLNDLGALLLTVHSTSLAPGTYRLEIDGLPRGGAPVPVGRFSLRIVARG